MIQVIVAGSKGRMGRRIIHFVEAASDLAFAAGVDKGDALDGVIDRGDVVIDFTAAAASAENAGIAARHRRPIVIGTTGLDATQLAALREAAARVPVVFAPNMSIGVGVLFHLLTGAARALPADFAVAITETHHVHKLDAPSGTAKKAREIIAAASGRSPDAIPIDARREGEVVGDHEIVFRTPEETLTIAHHAATRDIFAKGAILAARWIVGKTPGLYGMNDVLGLA